MRQGRYIERRALVNSNFYVIRGHSSDCEQLANSNQMKYNSKIRRYNYGKNSERICTC